MTLVEINAGNNAFNRLITTVGLSAGEAGWLRVRVTPYAESPRIYDGVLPHDLAPGVAAAFAVALSSEIDWIESHALDVNRGKGTSGPLEQSVPMGR